MKIVVIEDNPDILEVVAFILNGDGHEVLLCEDGSIVDNLHNVKPELIFMDELLPGKRGSELCRQIKANDAIKHIPVVLISTMPHLEKIAQKCGADAYLEKPFNISSLSEIIERLVK